jgi:hypothetical protein
VPQRSFAGRTDEPDHTKLGTRVERVITARTTGQSLTRTVQQYSAMSCGGEYIDNLLDGFVGAVVCGFMSCNELTR